MGNEYDANMTLCHSAFPCSSGSYNTSVESSDFQLYKEDFKRPTLLGRKMKEKLVMIAMQKYT